MLLPLCEILCLVKLDIYIYIMIYYINHCVLNLSDSSEDPSD